MIFPGFPGVLSFFQVFQVEWEPWWTQIHHDTVNVSRFMFKCYESLNDRFPRDKIISKYKKNLI